jgi:DNA-directed RNA polymerase sigma subunit (sigma70/sigma32)
MGSQNQLQPQERDIERDAKFIRLWKTGSYTKSSLARMFKITRERARQIVVRYEKEAINE